LAKKRFENLTHVNKLNQGDLKNLECQVNDIQRRLLKLKKHPGSDANLKKK